MDVITSERPRLTGGDGARLAGLPFLKAAEDNVKAPSDPPWS